jgi:hypothetical protein
VGCGACGTMVVVWCKRVCLCTHAKRMRQSVLLRCVRVQCVRVECVCEKQAAARACARVHAFVRVSAHAHQI